MVEQPFFQVALPIVIALFVAIWVQNRSFDNLNKRFDDINGRFDDINKRIDDLRDALNRRLDEVIKRLDKIEVTLERHDHRITMLESRTLPVIASR